MNFKSTFTELEDDAMGWKEANPTCFPTILSKSTEQKPNPISEPNLLRSPLIVYVFPVCDFLFPKL